MLPLSERNPVLCFLQQWNRSGRAVGEGDEMAINTYSLIYQVNGEFSPARPAHTHRCLIPIYPLPRFCTRTHRMRYSCGESKAQRREIQNEIRRHAHQVAPWVRGVQRLGLDCLLHADEHCIAKAWGERQNRPDAFLHPGVHRPLQDHSPERDGEHGSKSAWASDVGGTHAQDAFHRI